VPIQGTSVLRPPYQDSKCIDDSVHGTESPVICALTPATDTAVSTQNDDINLSIEAAEGGIGVHVSDDATPAATVGTVEATSTHITTDVSVSIETLKTLDSADMPTHRASLKSHNGNLSIQKSIILLLSESNTIVSLILRCWR
jgi:hypothetical protein